MNKKYRNEIIYYVGLFFSAVFLSCVILNIWSANLTIPFNFSQDGIGWSVIVKNYIEGGHVSFFENYGAPFVNTWEYMPEFSLSLNIIIKILSYFIDKFGIIMNGIFFLSMGLVACSAAFCFRKCEMNTKLAFVFGLMYTNLPYHYYRSTQHLNLSLYFMIPIMCYIAYLLLNDKFIKNNRINKSLLAKCCVAFFIMGISDLYYAFFSVLVIGIAWLYNIINIKKLNRCIPFASMIMACILGLVTCFVVWWLNIGHIGTMETLDARSIFDLEVYGLKISSLILPVKGHLLSPFSSITETYLTSTPYNEEGAFASLGLIGTMGLIVSILSLFYYKKENDNVKKCGLMNVFILFVSVNGGLNILIALFVTASIRCYNRMSLFIAFFSFLALGLFIDKWIKKIKLKKMVSVLVVVIGCLGILDQISSDLVPNYSENKEKYDEAAVTGQFLNEFCDEQENIFFLPFQNSNNYNQINGHDRYEVYLPSLFTENLEWALYYGETNRNLWAEKIANQEIEDMITSLYADSFYTIVMDKELYDNNSFENTKKWLEKNVGEAEFVSPNHRYYVYSLKNCEYIEENYSEKEIDKIRKTNYILEDFGEGFYDLEKNKEQEWIWSQQESTLKIENFWSEDIEIKIEFDVYSLDKDKLTISKDKKILKEVDLEEKSKKITIPMILKQGENTIKFSFQGKEKRVDGDDRALGFCIRNMKIKI